MASPLERQLERLKQKYSNLNNNYEKQREKVDRRYEEYLAQAPGSVRDQLKFDWQREKEVLEELEAQLDELERQLKEQPKEREAQSENEGKRSVEIKGEGKIEQQSVEEYQKLKQEYLERFIQKLDVYGIEYRHTLSLVKFYIDPHLIASDNWMVASQARLHQRATSTKSQQHPPEPISYNFILDELLDDKKSSSRIITGDPGLGKTTLLKRIGIAYAEKAKSGVVQCLPIFIELAKYASYIQDEKKEVDTLTTLASYIANKVLRYDFHSPVEVVEEQLQAGKYLILMDALDEIGNSLVRRQVVENIKFVLESTKCSFIISSRTAVYKYNLPIVNEELQPFGIKQIEAYIENSIKLRQKDSSDQASDWVEDLLAELPGNKRLRDMLSNPLFLYMMVKTLSNSRDERPIPDQQVELYTRYVTHLIEERPSLRQLKSELSLIDEPKRQHDYLDQIAHELHTSGLQQNSEDNMIKYIEKISSVQNKDKIANDLDFLATEIGLLQKISVEEYSFWHLTFQEYFTAEYLWRNKDEGSTREFFQTHLMSPWWHEVIVIYCAHSYKSAGSTYHEWLLEELIKGDDTIFATRTLLAVDCLMAAGRDLHSHYKRVYNHVKQKYHDTPYYQQQDILFRALHRLSGRSFLPFLREELRLADREGTIRAIKALSELDKEEDTQSAIRLLEELYENDRGLNSEVIGALICINTEQTKALIMGWLIHDHEYTAMIISQIIETDRSGWFEMLLESIAEVQPIKWMQESIEQLGRVTENSPCLPVVQEKFWQWFQYAHEGRQRSEVILLLNAIYFPVAEEFNALVYAYLDVALTDNLDASLLQAVVRFLGRQRASQANDLFFDLLFGERLAQFTLEEKRRVNLHAEILCSWIQVGDAEVSDYIKEYLLNSSSPVLWTKAIIALGEYGGEEYFDFLVAQLRSPVIDRNNPQETKTVLISTLYQMGVRLAKRPQGVRPPPELWRYVLEYLKVMTLGLATLKVTAYMFCHWAGNEDKEKYLSLMQERSALGMALVEYLLEPGCPATLRKWICEGDFLEVFVKSAFAKNAAVFVFQVNMQLLLPSDRRKELLRKELQSTKPDMQRKAVEIACEGFDPNDKEIFDKLIAWLHHADIHTHSSVISDVIERIGKSNTLEMITETEKVLERFLYGDDPDLKQIAFSARLSIDQRRRSLDPANLAYEL